MQSESMYVAQNLGQKDRKLAQKVGQFGRIPKSVIYDVELSASARCVFAALALTERKGIASIGQRRLAKSLGMARQTVADGLSELRERGHIKTISEGTRRAVYTLQSELFRSSVNAKASAFVSSPRPRCSDCGKIQSSASVKTGWCISCRNAKEIARQVEGELRRRESAA